MLFVFEPHANVSGSKHLSPSYLNESFIDKDCDFYNLYFYCRILLFSRILKIKKKYKILIIFNKGERIIIV